MRKIPKRQIEFVEKAISPLYEVESFLNASNNIFDVLKILKLVKIIKRH